MSTATQPNGTPGFLSRHRDSLLIGGLLALVGIGLVGLSQATDWADIRDHILALGPLQIAALLGLSLVNYFLRGVRWHLFARRLGLPTTLGQDLRHFLGGFAMSVTPGRVGELIRMRWLKRETGWAVKEASLLRKLAMLYIENGELDLAAPLVGALAGDRWTAEDESLLDQYRTGTP